MREYSMVTSGAGFTGTKVYFEGLSCIRGGAAYAGH